MARKIIMIQKHENESGVIQSTNKHSQSEYDAAMKTWDMIKFQPTTYRYWIEGQYKLIGIIKIDHKAYEYWKAGVNDDGVTLEALYEDRLYDENKIIVPSYANIFPSKGLIDRSDVYFGTAAVASASVLFIGDQDYNVFFESSLEFAELDRNKISYDLVNTIDSTLFDGGPVLIWEECFDEQYFFNKFELKSPFEPSKFCLSYDNVLGEILISEVSYQNKNMTQYGARGWSDCKFRVEFLP
jgi:hypothetical protein